MNILKTEKPQTIANILNGKQTLLVMKKAPKNGAGRWWYLYCSKGNKKDWHLIEVVNSDTGWEGYEYDYYIGSKGYLDWCLEGKVVARFWCDKVEEIINKCVSWDTFEGGNEVFERSTHSLSEKELEKLSCLSYDDLDDYLGWCKEGKVGYAIHISKLEIFDKPRELSEFHTVNKYGIPQYQFGKGTCDYKKLTKAPTNYCYIGGE